MSRVLVTGAGGFIGSHVVPLLVARGHEVHAATRGIGYRSDVTWHDTDLMDGVEVMALMEAARPETLLHLAWYTSPSDYWWARQNVDWVEATIRLARVFASCGGRRFVGGGTCAEYDTQYGLCSERFTPLLPSTLYGITKNATRAVIEGVADQWGMEFVWPRIFFPYGPREPSSKLVSYVIGRLLDEKEAQCTAGVQLRDYIYVADAAALLVHLVEGNVVGAFNVGSGVPVAVGDVAMTVGRLMGLPHLVQLGSEQDRDGDPPSRSCSLPN